MSDAASPLFEARNIVKRFGELEANRGVGLAVGHGERHALIGENGAGKSTLVKMMYGVMQPTAGAFFWQGRKVVIRRPAEARALGIGMVFQHFSVFDALTVAENIALALPAEPMRALARRIAAVSETYRLAIDPKRAVHTLSVGEKQRVEIIRCLLQHPRLLIMDEPTSVLTPQEAEILFETLHRLSEEGCSILYISHKLDEVKALCETATILRRGEVAGRCDPRSESVRRMAELMVGHEIGEVEKAATGAAGEVRLALRHLSLPAPGEFGVSLKDVSLEVRAGEIVGIAGVAGEGQAELMEALTGERASPADAAIEVGGVPLGRAGATRRRLAGAAFVPEERNGHAAVAEMPLSHNILLTHHTAQKLAPRGWIAFGAAAEWSARVRETFDVRAAPGDPPAGSLSGGNLQKFVVGRDILRAPRVLVVSQPTWGVDAGAATTIRRALVELAAAGAAVLVISQDLEEIFAICDRIAVIHHGRLSKLHPAAEMSPERVGLLMGGAHPEDAELAVVEAA